MRIGFLSNQLDNRGTGNAMFDYAHYNETILGNESVIFTFPQGNHDTWSAYRYTERFGPYRLLTQLNDLSDIDALYHIKSGAKDWTEIEKVVKYLVHSVFDNEPHGHRYATISEWMGNRYNLPWVPHIIDPAILDDNANLRLDLDIPEDAKVFGRHGGPDTFDIPWVWDAIDRILAEDSNAYFVFMNTNIPERKFSNPRNIITLAPTVNPIHKRMFINTCDAMLHARARGETFGMAVGEFAACSKPVFTYKDSPERAHIEQLGDWGHYYSDEVGLYLMMRAFNPREGVVPALYQDFTPQKVMLKFKEVFLA